MLNATYEPLTVVSVRRAVVLVVGNKAELVHAREQRWHSERMALPIPTVIRLRRFVRVPYRRRIALSRRARLTPSPFGTPCASSVVSNATRARLSTLLALMPCSSSRHRTSRCSSDLARSPSHSHQPTRGPFRPH